MSLKKLLADPKEVRFTGLPPVHTDPALLLAGWVFKHGMFCRLKDFDLFERTDRKFAVLLRAADQRGELYRIGRPPYTTLMVGINLPITLLV